MSADHGGGWDWAGVHGTVWGTINCVAAPVAVSAALHEVVRYRHLPPVGVALVPFLLTVAADVWIVISAAGGRPRPRATVWYMLVCWTFAGLWCTYMVGRQMWTSSRWLLCVGVLVAGGILAGGIASLGVEPETKNPADADTSRAQKVRDRLAADWIDRCERIAHQTVTVYGIARWPSGGGYTVEGEVGEGGATWRTIEAHAEAFAGDLNMADGCRLTVQRGITRRRFLIDVMTKDLLAADYDYPENRAVHSINNALDVGVTDDGTPIGPCLRARSLAVGGEPGSGKSNAALCYAAEIITTDDALLWQWDPTGKLWAALMDPWLSGDIDVPPVDWAAAHPREIRLQLRAAYRIATVRPVAYRRAVLAADDDKIPVGPDVPAVMVMGDEVKKITGAPAVYPDLQDLAGKLTEEGRAGAVRTLFFPLRGTDDMFLSGIQALCHVLGVMKVKSASEASWMLGGTGGGFGPEDTPYPGCGGLRLESGADTTKVKYYRMRPSTVRRIVEDAQTRRPVLDEVSRLAANGRNADGTPMPGLLPGELDCYDTRWERFMDAFGYEDGRTDIPATPGTPPQAAPAGSTLGEEVAKLAATEAALAAAVEKARTASGDDGVELSADENAQFAAMMEAEGFGADWAEDVAPETPPKPTDQEAMLRLIVDAGARGIKPRDLHAALITSGIVFSRDTLHKRLNELRAAGLVFQPSHGRWAAAQPE